MSILCKLGFHKWVIKEYFFPSIEAEIVTRFILHRVCKKCLEYELITDMVWDETIESFVETV